MKKVLAIDYDGVLCKSQERLVQLFNNDHGTNHSIREITGWKMEDILGIDHNQLMRMFEIVWEDYKKLPPTEKNIGQIVSQLKNRGNYEIMILTKRDEHHIEDTISWLDYNKVPFDDFVHIPTEDNTPKHAFPWNFLVDDAPQYISGIPEDRIGFLYDQPWNRNHGMERYPYRISKISDLIRFNIL